MAASTIYIYNGKGVYPPRLPWIVTALNEVVDLNRHTVSYITPEAIIEGSWAGKAALLIMGEGFGRGFTSVLGDIGVGKIRTYVEGGGSFLGLGAGGYYGCDYTEFDKNGPQEVVGERFLKFFPGIGRGPTYPGFQYESYKGALAAPLEFWLPKMSHIMSFESYNNGGHSFLPYNGTQHMITDHIPQSSHGGQTYETVPRPYSSHEGANPSKVTSIEILARYTNITGHPVAAVKTTVGRGGACVLTGTHIEYSSVSFPADNTDVQTFLTALTQSEVKRRLFLASILKQLGISTR